MPFLTFNEYQEFAQSTAIYPDDKRVVYPALGLSGETGEVCEKIKKIFRDQGGVVTEDNKTQIKKELGDVLWYIAALCRDFDLSMADVAQTNVDKLRDRQQRNKLQGSGDNR